MELDVSANVANLEAADFADLSLASIDEAIELQAGIEPDLKVRGEINNQIGYIVDGMNLRTGRFLQSFTNISMTSVEQVQVQTGGFNAEHTNVRSGLINITTKEPSRRRFSFDVMYRLEPAQPKNFGGLPEDLESYGVRLWQDPEVAFDGTAVWDPYTRLQYLQFEGWNAVAARMQGDGFDLTPQELFDLEAYGLRKSNEIDSPDYVADVTLSGPLLPSTRLGRQFGDPRFLFSYRGSETMYLYPQARAGYVSETILFKTTADVAEGVRLSMTGMRASERGINRAYGGPISDIWKGEVPYYPWAGTDNGFTTTDAIDGHFPVVGFSDASFNRLDIDHILWCAELTHTFRPNSFYEIRVQSLRSNFNTSLPDLRDDSFEGDNGVFVSQLWAEDGVPVSDNAVCAGGGSDLNGDGRLVPYCVGQAPLGFATQNEGPIRWDRASFGSGTRDTSQFSVFKGRFDLTSQLNRYLQIKTGAEIIVDQSDYRAAGINLQLGGPTSGDRIPFSHSIIHGGLYTQARLEFGGMIANLGVRMDYIDPITKWWILDDPYDQALNSNVDELDALLPKKQVEPQVFLSPRVGVSFPISERSKIYFNYGHFRQQVGELPGYSIVQSRAGGIEYIGNPDLPMSKTVAYEIGFDQNMFDQFLIRISGYYRDISDQFRFVNYTGLGSLVRYSTAEPWNYADSRGVEVSMTKHRGDWFEGFLNYTFLQRKEGNFGYSQFYENQFLQRDYLRTTTDFFIFAPTATPFARMSLTAKTPDWLGPLKGNWRLNLSGEWRDGQQFFWDGLVLGDRPQEARIAGLDYNVSWRDNWMLDLRLSKYIQMRYGGLQLFLDVSNVLNLRYLNRTTGFSFFGNDQQWYMTSLHLPGDVFEGFGEGGAPYLNIPGNDQPGDFRKPGVDFQPINAVPNLENARPDPWAWFWSQETGSYHRWSGEAWEDVPADELQRALDDKAYIDMPNLGYNTFFNPRRFSLGLRFSF